MSTITTNNNNNNNSNNATTGSTLSDLGAAGDVGGAAAVVADPRPVAGKFILWVTTCVLFACVRVFSFFFWQANIPAFHKL